MVFNATFNNISVISWWPVLLVEETGGPGENHLIPVNNSNYHNMMPAMAAIEKDIYFN
jgi:hypothetical protein